MDEEFAALATKLPAPLRALLIDNADPASVPLPDLLQALHAHPCETPKRGDRIAQHLGQQPSRRRR